MVVADCFELDSLVSTDMNSEQEEHGDLLHSAQYIEEYGWMGLIDSYVLSLMKVEGSSRLSERGEFLSQVNLSQTEYNRANFLGLLKLLWDKQAGKD